MISEIMYSSLNEPTLKPKMSKLYENANFLQITETLILGRALIAVYGKSTLSDTLLYFLCKIRVVFTLL